ncbi:MAG: HAMP domain-containing histidine kinase [Pseudomonadota bacterium]|nr:HAMP domain-containing histidine kinase [Pseudomonadota bacterium]
MSASPKRRRFTLTQRVVWAVTATVALFVGLQSLLAYFEREFAANLDHEIRTPLTTIRTDAELIALESTLAPAAQQRIDRIIASVDDIVAPTESTPSSSAGRAERVAPIALRECLRTVCDALADRAAQRDLRIDIAVDSGPSLVADWQALLTVCRNLVRNAIEHAAPATRASKAMRAASASATTAWALRQRRCRTSSSDFIKATAPTTAPTRAIPRPRRGAASAWPLRGGCATCRAGDCRCARRSRMVAARPSRSTSRRPGNGIFTPWPRPEHAAMHSVSP